MDTRLEALLTALQARGVPVGVDERLRLSVVLGRMGEADAEALGRAIVAIVVKDPAWRPEVEALVEAWRATHAPRLETPPTPPAPHAPPSPMEAVDAWEPQSPAGRAVEVWRERRGGARRWWVGLLVVGVGLGVWWWAWDRDDAAATPQVVSPVVEPPAKIEPPPKVEPPPDDGTTDPPPAEPAPRQILTAVPTLEIHPYEPPFPWPPLGVAALSLSALGLALAILRLRPRDPPPLPAAEPREVSAPPPGARLRPGELLRLDPSEQEDLSASLSQRVRGEPSPTLDVERTVHETAAQLGLPCLVFVPRREPLGLWLWVDLSSTHPDLDALRRELDEALGAAGLPFAHAEFYGVPDALWTAEGTISPFDLETRQRGRVLILSDGLVLGAAARRDLLGERVPPLLAELAAWEDLLWVDPGDELARVLGPGHRVVHPSELVQAVSGGRLRAPGAGEDLELWRACLALYPEPVPPDAALRLRSHLALRVSPWWVEAATGDLDRRAALRWLEAATAYPRAGLPTSALTALAWWREAVQESERQAREHPGFVGSEAEARLWLTAALLDLWELPTKAIPRLWSLHEGPLRAEVRAAVAGLCDATLPANEGVRLPWRIDRLDAEHRKMLAQIGFGAELGLRLPGTTAPPGRRALGLGALAGAAAASLALAWSWEPEIPEITLEEAGSRGEEPGWARCEGGRCAAAGRSVWAREEEVPAGAEVTARWSLEERDCEEALPTGRLLRCTSAGQRPPAWEGRPTFSGVQLLVESGASVGPELLDCAATFLDSGSADVVLISADREDLDRLRAPEDGQSLRVEGALLARLGAEGECRRALVAEVSRPASATIFAEAEGGDSFALGTLSTLRPLRWVTIPAGEGVIGDDNSSYDDENPRWKVRFTTDIEMLDTEVTRAQYAAQTPGWRWDGSDPDLPVTGVRWSEAVTFCDAIGGRLPSEVEWEYAARAGTTTAYSFGDSSSRLGDYTWYSGNAEGSVHPVAQKLPNAWGLYDMHGNAWEWVEDVYDANAWDAKPQDVVVVDPGANVTIVDNIDARVLRGGSARNVPEFLRSSDRYWNYPRFLSGGIGFRCVSGPRRQP